MENLEISTGDPDEARLKVSEVYCDHRLLVVKSHHPFHLNHIGAAVDGVGVYLMSYGTHVEVKPGMLEDFALVQIPLQGRALDRIDGKTIETHSKLGSVVGPNQELEMEWAPGTSKLVLHIPNERIYSAAKALGSMSGTDEFKLKPSIDLSDPVHRSWYGVVRSLAGDVRYGGPMASNPLLAPRIADAIVLGLVMNQGEQQPSTLPQTLDEIDSIDHAIRILESHPERPWRMSDLAREVNLSARKLSKDFKERTDMTPMEFVQFIRLHRVHYDLRSALPASTSVTELALRWGFNHLGRFSARYQQMFGELPSDTLRR